MAVTEKQWDGDDLIRLRQEIASKDKVIAANSVTITDLFREQMQIEEQLGTVAIEECKLNEQGERLADRMDNLEAKLREIQQSDIQKQNETLDKVKVVAVIVIFGLIASSAVFGVAHYV
jgi:hypothetical protein